MSDGFFLIGILLGIVWPVCWAAVMVNRSDNQRRIETDESVHATRQLEMRAKYDLDKQLLLEANNDD